MQSQSKNGKKVFDALLILGNSRSSMPCPGCLRVLLCTYSRILLAFSAGNPLLELGTMLPEVWEEGFLLLVTQHNTFVRHVAGPFLSLFFTNGTGFIGHNRKETPFQNLPTHLKQPVNFVEWMLQNLQ